MRFCAQSVGWHCDWCNCTPDQCTGKNPGPNGPATLCNACGSRFRGGATGPPVTTEDGRYLCEGCGRSLLSLAALATHRRRCDGGNWRCSWCNCSYDDCLGRNPGPDGPATLCGACGSRFRGGATGPPATNAEGNFLCEDCGKALETMSGLGAHRRFCDGLMSLGDLYFALDEFPFEDEADSRGLAANLAKSGCGGGGGGGSGGSGGADLSNGAVQMGPWAPSLAPLLPQAPEFTQAALATWDLACHVALRVEVRISECEGGGAAWVQGRPGSRSPGEFQHQQISVMSLGDPTSSPIGPLLLFF